MVNNSNEIIELFRRDFNDFATNRIMPYAELYDKEERISDELIKHLGQEGYLGASIPLEYGGKGWSQTVMSILYEEIGKVCSSTRSLLTVHLSLVSETINRWGTKAQKEYWLPMLASGAKIASFALTEPNIGSDARNIQSTYTKQEDCFILNGTKKWISFGQLADVVLVFSQNNSGVSAFLVETSNPGLEIAPIIGMMGTRASMLAEITLNDCRVPLNNLLGNEGWGYTQIVNTALDNGRFSVATGSLGIAKACLEHSCLYIKKRKQFGVFLKEHQLIKQKITVMASNIKAAALLCQNAARLRDLNDPDAILQTCIAKYFTSRIANDAASDALQIHGALGFHHVSPIQRFYRDAKIMEVIEGTSEILQIAIADEVISSFNNFN